MATSMGWSPSEKIDKLTYTKQQEFVVISWNILHMVHEINYVYDMSPVINRYSIQQNLSNEKLRLNDIVKTISDLLIKHSKIECFICLQEVPNDLLPMLHRMLDSHMGSTFITKPLIHIQVYPRKPHIRGRMEGYLYTDFRESLVTIHHNPYIVSNKEKCQLSSDQLRWTPCPSDNGKGALSVTTASGLTVINTHVPSDSQAAWSLLNNIAWPENNNAFVFVGDMNCRSEVLMKMINDITKGKPSSGFLFPITTNKPSRTAMNQNGSRRYVWIDHYVISACLKQSVISPAIVYNEIGDISDHYPILLSFKTL